MILGTGIDIVQVDRFEPWQKATQKKLLRVFSEEEIHDSLDQGIYNLEFLASRFAAKEAFFKALSASLVKLKLTKNKFSFLFACKNVEVVKPIWGVPDFKINLSAFEKRIAKKLPKLSVDLSISHEKTHVIAFVVISKI